MTPMPAAPVNAAREHRPPLAITMGDAAGVGPEIVLRAWADGALGDNVVVYGDAAILHAGAALLGLHIDWQLFPLVDLGLLSVAHLVPGQLSAATGSAARAYVERATLDALAGAVSGLVTLPMNKEATQLTDPKFTGHTELIGELCGSDDVTIMLASPDLKIGRAHV